jgi:hypothetical protein
MLVGSFVALGYSRTPIGVTISAPYYPADLLVQITITPQLASPLLYWGGIFEAPSYTSIASISAGCKLMSGLFSISKRTPST